MKTEELIDTKNLIKKFKKFKLTRAKLFYLERYGGLFKVQRIEKGRLKNYYKPAEVKKALKESLKKSKQDYALTA